MPATQSCDDPSEPIARLPPPGGRAALHLRRIEPDDSGLRATLGEWDWTARALARGAARNETRLRLEDGRRIVGELARVLSGEEEGEGTADDRAVIGAFEGGRLQAVASVFLCPRAVFVELIATAPWNLLGPEDPRDERAVRGAGGALVAWARAFSVQCGRCGRVALQAENPRCLRYYQRIGFERMTARDLPYTLVPPGDHGFSGPVRRVAEACESPEEERSPWLLLDPERQAPRGGLAIVLRAVAQAIPAAP